MKKPTEHDAEHYVCQKLSKSVDDLLRLFVKDSVEVSIVICEKADKEPLAIGGNLELEDLRKLLNGLEEKNYTTHTYKMNETRCNTNGTQEETREEGVCRDESVCKEEDDCKGFKGEERTEVRRAIQMLREEADKAERYLNMMEAFFGGVFNSVEERVSR